MTRRSLHRVFAPRAWAVLGTAALLAVFVSLGGWQLGRAREKQTLIDGFTRGSRTSIVLQDAAVDELPRYQHMTVSGRYDAARQILLDNMPSSRTGRPGFRVLTPLAREGTDRLLMVDRGWVPLGATRADLPRVQVSPAARIVAGRLDQLPVPGVRVGAAGTAGDTRWPRVLNFPRQADLEGVLGAPVESRILLLDPAAPAGYERAWRPAVGFGPERHVGYAVQWFALAMVLLVIFVTLSFRSIAPHPPSVHTRP